MTRDELVQAMAERLAELDMMPYVTEGMKETAQAMLDVIETAGWMSYQAAVNMAGFAATAAYQEACALYEG